MIARCSIFLLAALIGSGCTTSPPNYALQQSRVERTDQIHAAAHAVRLGDYETAESLLSPYLYRDKSGELRFHPIGFAADGRKAGIDTVTQLLWETGRDSTLELFIARYLGGYERGVMRCRISERGALYEEAYHCWNELGDRDRAERVMRTEAASRLLLN
tara:strand:- start:84387 stop:84866 length:480 start_codon:yes stop_codon:yes gene_type:complete